MYNLKYSFIYLSQLLILLTVLSILPGCPWTSKQTLDVEGLRELSKLATVEYKFSKIVKSTKSTFWGTRKILFQVDTSMKAGIDMNKIKEQDIKNSKDSITIRLPKPEILHLQFEPEGIVEKYNESGIFTRKFNQEEIYEILRLGEEDMRKAIDNDAELLAMAGINARVVIETWIKNIEKKKKIIIKIKSN
jgi:hypothetical protein